MGIRKKYTFFIFSSIDQRSPIFLVPGTSIARPIFSGTGGVVLVGSDGGWVILLPFTDRVFMGISVQSNFFGNDLYLQIFSREVWLHRDFNVNAISKWITAKSTSLLHPCVCCVLGHQKKESSHHLLTRLTPCCMAIEYNSPSFLTTLSGWCGVAWLQGVSCMVHYEVSMLLLLPELPLEVWGRHWLFGLRCHFGEDRLLWRGRN